MAMTKEQIEFIVAFERCDGIRRRVKSPLVAARMMSDLMHRKLDKLRQAFNGEAE